MRPGCLLNRSQRLWARQLVAAWSPPGLTALYSRVTGKLVDPRTKLAVAPLELRDLRLASKRELDRVAAAEQGLALQWVHGERDHAPAWGGDLAALKVDAELSGGRLVGQRVELCLRERDRKQPILEATVEEDVAEARCDDADRKSTRLN